jgi:hypothetical protein
MLIKRVITEGIIGIKQELNLETVRQKLDTVVAQSKRKKV